MAEPEIKASYGDYTGADTIVTPAKFAQIYDALERVSFHNGRKPPIRVGTSREGWSRWRIPSYPRYVIELPPVVDQGVSL